MATTINPNSLTNIGGQTQVSTTTSTSSSTPVDTGIASLFQDYGRTLFGPGASTNYLPSTDGGRGMMLSPEGKAIAGMLFAASSSAIEAKWAGYVGKLANEGGPIDVNELVQAVLREAYTANTQDLRFFAEKVKFYNELKKQIRDELTRARETFAGTAGQADTASVSFSAVSFDTTFYGPRDWDNDGDLDYTNPSPTSGGTAPVVTTRGNLDAYIKGLEEKLNSVGDDAQLANVDLQNMLQKQQQTLQMLSNISKMLHDTAMAVIRKIGG